MSKHGKRRELESSEIPEEQQHEPITLPEGSPEQEALPIPIPDTMMQHVQARLTPPPGVEPATVKTMIEQATARPVMLEQRLYRCVYDEQAIARMVPVGAADPTLFCPVCGERVVRER